MSDPTQAQPSPDGRRVAASTPDFTDALEKIILGAVRRIVLSEEERQRAAYQAAGIPTRRPPANDEPLAPPAPTGGSDTASA